MTVVMLIKGHHVEVGVGVLPSWEGRRCYSGLWPWYRYQRWWRCRQDDVVYREVQQMELMMKAVVTEWTVVMWWTVWRLVRFGVIRWRIGFWCRRCRTRFWTVETTLRSSFIRKTVSSENACVSMSNLLNGFGFGFQENLLFWNSRRILMAATGGVVMLKMLYEMWRIGV